jgi:thiamine biosynthesis lipoprotein ApbE|tara:strand:- start:64 stop:264 length:201 start_codon:yes stop_codon:yes gene_type:complete
MRYEQKAELQDSNKSRMYEENKKMSSEKQSSCHECNYDEGTNLLKYDQSIYYLCDDCYEEHMKEEE